MGSSLPLYDTAAMRALEARATAVCDGDAFALMARAGQAAWQCVLRHWPRAHRIVVACGPGNNGGDGYVLALHAQRSGRDVRVLRLPVHAPATGLAQRACDEYLAAGGCVSESQDGLRDAELVVDALFGIGLSRAPEGEVARLIDAINAQPAPVLSLDAPSGVDARNGHTPGVAVDADCTLQFIAAHLGLRTGAALDCVGDLELARLDLPASVFDGIAPAAYAHRADALAGMLPLRRRDSHKGRNGHVLCIGGDHGSGGAILLASDAALRCGAGLASVATRAAHVSASLARQPEAMVHAVEAPADARALIERASVIAIGPGLGQGAWGHALFGLALACDKPRVFDADALNLLASAPQRLTANDVLTPHPGEAARLLGIDTATVQRDRFGAAHALCERYGSHVVLKGAGSVVASPGATPALVAAGNPGMAVGGMGDLLTGCIAALLAQGLSARDAAIAGTLLHAAAGDAAAREDGERGLRASDLLPWLRRLANPVRR